MHRPICWFYLTFWVKWVTFQTFHYKQSYKLLYVLLQCKPTTYSKFSLEVSSCITFHLHMWQLPCTVEFYGAEGIKQNKKLVDNFYSKETNQSNTVTQCTWGHCNLGLVKWKANVDTSHIIYFVIAVLALNEYNLQFPWYVQWFCRIHSAFKIVSAKTSVTLQKKADRPTIKVLGHQYQWLAGGYDLEIGHF